MKTAAIIVFSFLVGFILAVFSFGDITTNFHEYHLEWIPSVKYKECLVLHIPYDEHSADSKYIFCIGKNYDVN